jgi:glutathione S-transferase
VRTWEALADGLMDAALEARLERTWPGRSEEQRSQAWIDRQMGKIDAALAAMAKGLGDKPFCAGIHLTLANIAVGCALGYLDFHFAQVDWRRRRAEPLTRFRSPRGIEGPREPFDTSGRTVCGQAACNCQVPLLDCGQYTR